MAGAGRRTFQPGEVLTASNVNSYLMDQSVMRFASSAARGSAVGTAVIAEGMVSYLDDVNALEFYDGAAWNQFASGSGLPVANGGTGGTTVAAAKTSLGIAQNFAAGKNTVNGVTAITLPSGRFSVAPIVTCTPEFGGASANSFYSVIAAVSSTSISLYAVTNNGTLYTTNFDMHWMAVQMLTGAAAG